MFRFIARAALAAAALHTALPALAQDAPADWNTYVPPLDGTFQTWGEEPPDIELVKRLFALAYPEACGWALGTGATPEPTVFEFTYKPRYDEPGSPERPFRLYQIFCSAGAYNEQAVFLGWDSVDGIRTLYFSYPDLDIAYTDEEETKVESITVTGITAAFYLTNPTYDEATRTIAFASYWRGMGDASSTGTYAFSDGEFVLKTYDVDASYDGEINPVRVVDYSKPHVID